MKSNENRLKLQKANEHSKITEENQHDPKTYDSSSQHTQQHDPTTLEAISYVRKSNTYNHTKSNNMQHAISGDTTNTNRSQQNNLKHNENQ